MRQTSKKACVNCRKRHVKCDRQQPCRRCRDSGLSCKQPAVHAFCNVSFAGDHSSRADRTNVPLPESESQENGNKRTVFVDETPTVVKVHGNTERSTEQLEQEISSINSLPPELSPSAAFLFNHPPAIVGLPLAAGVHHANPNTGFDALPLGTSSSDLGNDIADHLGPSAPTILEVDRSTEADSQPPWDTARQPKRPITHPREAYLLKVFTQTWGQIFDCLDPDLTFTKSAIDIALNEFTPLYWAILATSALQLSRLSDYPLSAAKYYREQCSASIMPILLQSTHPAANEETLFATYVLIRNYEHMTENLMEKPRETLFTSSLAISVKPQDTLSENVDLGRAAFWVHLRQDIHVALLLQVPINVDYPPCIQKDKILEDMEYITTQRTGLRKDTIDCAWANRIAVLLVDVMNYCFQESTRELEPWLHMRSRLDHWNAAKPRRFNPYYERTPDPSSASVFPDIWISCDSYVLAWLYYHTAKILLKTFPPNREDLSFDSRPTRSTVVDSLEDREEVLIHARAICGIAITNPNAQALIVVCHMVTISAIFFSTELEQNATIDLIKLAHTVTGHPLRDIEEKLHNCWSQQAN